MGRSFSNGAIAASHELLGSSAAIQAVRYFVREVAASDATCLITGPSGSGKEVVAKLLHRQSPRAKAPVVSINCGAIPRELIESELFGHEKGAFTGATAARLGRFEAADGGTLFLDEIGDMPLDMQVKLLRVLEERVFERIGDNRTRAFNTRVVTATHRDLPGRIADGEFREDLYYRLNIFPIHLPPLNQRREDVAELAEHFARHFGDGAPAFTLTPDAIERLTDYDWPGNVRELKNWAERASVLYRGKQVDAAGTDFLLSLGRMREQIAAGDQVSPLPRPQASGHPPVARPPVMASVKAPADVPAPVSTPVPAKDTTGHDSPCDQIARGNVNLKQILEDIEMKFIESALSKTHHTIADAARLLGLQRTTLSEKIRKYNIQRDVA
jgi:sigma-54 specific flagellar transcriptional regulator A|tara:strand:- start:52483 stop:53637 length:1155 start_codon:yes stop_codon:yes gene_type:complete